MNSGQFTILDLRSLREYWPPTICTNVYSSHGWRTGFLVDFLRHRTIYNSFYPRTPQPPQSSSAIFTAKDFFSGFLFYTGDTLYISCHILRCRDLYARVYLPIICIGAYIRRNVSYIRLLPHIRTACYYHCIHASRVYLNTYACIYE